MATMKRCRVPMTLSGRWGSEHLWPGLDVNMERELAPGFTVAAAVAGREECFADVPADVVEEARKAILEDPSLERVPEAKRAEVINNKLKKLLGEQVLMMQPWVKDETMIVGDLVKKVIAETGENIVLRRFSRFALGEEEM